MKTLMILLATMVLAGCATSPTYIYPAQSRTVIHVTEVVQMVPSAIGTYVSASIFGGTVSYMPHPVYYIQEGINYDARYVYNNSRRWVYYNSQPPYSIPPRRRR